MLKAPVLKSNTSRFFFGISGLALIVLVMVAACGEPDSRQESEGATAAPATGEVTATPGPQQTSPGKDTPAPIPTATPVPPMPSPTPTPTPIPTAVPVPPTSSPTPTPTPIPTAVPVPPTPSPTPTQLQIPGRVDLYAPISPPKHMAYIWWDWKPDQDHFREMVTDFTIHNDVHDWSDLHGIYLILGYSSISDAGFYFGLQTDANRRGKGVIFSMWGTRDLANARYADTDGWTQSSGHEGDFIGVRRSYDWGVGDYRIRIASDSIDPDGEWFGLWITDLDTGNTTWIGSLKFPLLNGTAKIKPNSYATIEIYGVAPIRPIEIPQWHVSIKRPLGDNVPSIRGYTGYSRFTDDALRNSDVWYDPSEDVVHLRAGGTTERKTTAGYVDFK